MSKDYLPLHEHEWTAHPDELQYPHEAEVVVSVVPIWTLTISNTSGVALLLALLLPSAIGKESKNGTDLSRESATGAVKIGWGTESGSSTTEEEAIGIGTEVEETDLIEDLFPEVGVGTFMLMDLPVVIVVSLNEWAYNACTSMFLLRFVYFCRVFVICRWVHYISNVLRTYLMYRREPKTLTGSVNEVQLGSITMCVKHIDTEKPALLGECGLQTN